MHSRAFNRYMFGGHANVPMVVRTEAVSDAVAARHSKSLEPWLVNVPGLSVVIPSTPYDAEGCSRPRFAAITLWSYQAQAHYGQMGRRLTIILSAGQPMSNVKAATSRWSVTAGR